MRLIDADALNEKLCNTTIFIKSGEIFQRMINDAPTIEPNGDTISRSQAIKDVSEWATDILHPDKLIKEDAIHILESLPSAKQVTGKLNNPDGSLLTTDSEACKEQKSKLDLISRQDALAEFQDGRDVYDIMESIEELPSAPDSRQHGVWVKDPSYNGVRFVPVCSNCGKRPPRIEVGGKLVGGYGAEATGAVWRSELEYHQSDFCPSCGADMRGGEDE